MIWRKYIIIGLFCLSTSYAFTQSVSLSLPPMPALGKNDTILSALSIYEGEWLISETLPEVIVVKKISVEQYKKWLRMHRAVRKVYPYMKQMGKVILNMRITLKNMKTRREKRIYMKSKEKELLATFTAPMKKLSRYQGRILIKLINRETGNSCFELLKEYQGGFSAQLWQTVASMFGNSLKETYDPTENIEDQQIELLVQELENSTTYF